jgi:hypothetical protein
MELPAGRADLPALSDLLFLTSPNDLPGTLEDAVPLARRSTAVLGGERLGLFWESYPPPGIPAGPVTISVSIRGREAHPGALRWRESFPADVSVVPRAVALELAGLSPGRYAVEVEVIWPGAAPLRSRRDMKIRD